MPFSITQRLRPPRLLAGGLLLLFGWAAVADDAPPVSPLIVVDQFGYLPDAAKVAVLRDPVQGFDADLEYTPGDELTIVSAASGDVVFTGAPSPWNKGRVDELSGDRVWWFDFSDVTTPGRYYVADDENELRSPEFTIGADVYRPVLKEALRTFFYQRAGFAKRPPYADPAWQDGASHLNSLQDSEARLYSARDDASTARDLSGGWYDAGDLNRYTAWHANYIVTLAHAYLENPQAWGDDFDLPESGNGVPDIVDEILFGLEWQKKMQDGAEGGGLLSILSAEGASPPSAATEPSVYGPATTHATLAGAAAFALAAIVIDGLPDESYDDVALDLLRRAESAWQWAKRNPEVLFYNNRGEAAGVGAGQQETDAAGRAVDWRRAAVYLYAATGKDEYQQYVVLGHEYTPVVQWHGHIDTFKEAETATMLLYTVLPGADKGTMQRIRGFYRDALGRDHLGGAAADDRSAYRAWLQPEHYTWGSNSNVARQGQLFMNLALYGFKAPENYDVREAALGYLHYLHGVNPLGLVYLSNMEAQGATRSVREFYHSWFTDGSELWDRVGESTYGPAPGFLVGGPTLQYDRDACCPDACGSPENNRRCESESLVPPNGQPVLKAFKEFNTTWPLNSWIVTENSNGYQAAYLRLLANFVPPASGD